MSIDALAALFFVVFLAGFLWRKRKQVELQRALFPILYIVMYRSTFGLKAMDWLAKKFPKILKWAGYVSIVLGFVGMVLIGAQLIMNTGDVFLKKAAPGIQPVLPIEAKGVFFVPFIYWILSIFFLAVVHEFSHGVIARVHNIRVKSSGFAFLCALVPIIPAAFVEPDEKVVQKRPYKQQLSVFAAGPISNMVFALAMFGLFMVASPILSAAFDSKGVELKSISEDSAAFAGGLRDGDIVTSLNGMPANSIANLTSFLNASVPGEKVLIETMNTSMYVTLGSNPKNASQAYLGVQATPYFVAKPDFVSKYGAWSPPALRWVSGLIFWLFMLNIGIGLFNLLPIGPLDGGRMFQLVCFKFFKRETALRVWSLVGGFFVIIILANMIAGFVH